MSSIQLLNNQLEKVRTRLKLVSLLEGVLLLSIALPAVTVILLVADNIFWLPGSLRLTGLAVIGIIFFATFLLKIVIPARKKLSDEAIARHAEIKLGLNNYLINALQVGGQSNSESNSVKKQILADGVIIAENNDLIKSVNLAKLKKYGATLAGLGLCIALYVFFFNEEFKNASSRFLNPTVFIAPVSNTKVTVSPGDAVVLKGDNLLVRVEFSGKAPTGGYLEITRNKKAQEVPLEFDGQHFYHLFTNCYADFEYKAFLGDGISNTFNVRVATKPTVKTFTAVNHLPEYTGFKPLITKNIPAEMRVLKGSRVEFTADFNTKVKQAELILKSEKNETVKKSVENTNRLSFHSRWGYSGRIQDFFKRS